MKRTCIALPSREKINQVKLSLVQVSVLRDYGKLELNFAGSGLNPVRATVLLKVPSKV